MDQWVQILTQTQTGGILVKMFASEFDVVFSNFPIVKRHFSGCYSSDKIPKSIKTGNFIICNTQDSQSTGEHWYTFVKVSKTEVECFDSLGVDEEKKTFLKHNCHFRGVQEVTFNTTWNFDIYHTISWFIL